MGEESEEGKVLEALCGGGRLPAAPSLSGRAFLAGYEDPAGQSGEGTPG